MNAPLSSRFAGYAALFDVADAGRDTIRRGAFARTLAERRTPLPLYWQHRPDQPIGVIEHIAEDARGLRVIARIDRPDSRAAAMLAAGTVNGLSFGFRTRAARQSPAGRELLEVDLFEVSLVTHPLQHGARVHFVN
ncbi:HK97 family phage prohead protease [Porphyrobacter sp. AAP60]|uniref:HK97 family phage prohead protease n=1 Tax=Porphyrobacter sp. AAP60 TaxID=1523423 RepID=UPI0006B881FE|nr:HK97 family phage prohead protease [Porphyrobacter sp. AAP60]KPF63009.1 peptidase U35 [Porphyrobacter sp. AAP60]